MTRTRSAPSSSGCASSSRCGPGGAAVGDLVTGGVGLAVIGLAVAPVGLIAGLWPDGGSPAC